jgi:hypothetical protein
MGSNDKQQAKSRGRKITRSGGRPVDEIVGEAYKHVAEGFRLALMVPGLPKIEKDDLEACLRAASRIAREPWLFPREPDD